MFTNLEDVEGQAQMAHCLLAEESATVTPQKSLRTPLKMIGGHLLNRHDVRTPNSVGRSKMFGGFGGGNNVAEAMGLGASPRIFGTPCTKSANRVAAAGAAANSIQRPPPVQKHRVYNPFDTALIEHLQSPIFSPSVFATTKTPASCTKTPTFRWNIDELALIKPVNFDEAQDGYACAWESEVESRAQTAIDDFFARNHVIVPSPCERERGGPTNSRRSVATAGADCYHNSSQLRRVSEEKVVADVGCQTTLTLPVDFALDRLLADFYTFNSTTAGGNNMGGDDIAELSNLSLRRKLFSNAPIDASFNMSIVCPDSVDAKSTPSSCLSPHVSPVCGGVACRTPEPGSSKTITTVHASGYFSSSPIKNLQKSSAASGGSSEGIRRSSTAPRLLDSPSLSPFEKYTVQVNSKSSAGAAAAAGASGNLVSPLAACLGQGHDIDASASGCHRLHQSRCEMTPGLSPIFGFARGGAASDGSASTPSPADSGVMRGGKKDVGKLPLPLELWDDEALGLLDDASHQHLSTTPLQKQNHDAFLWPQESSSIATAAFGCGVLGEENHGNGDWRHHHHIAVAGGEPVSNSASSSSVPLTTSYNHQESGFQSTVLSSGNSLSSGLFNNVASVTTGCGSKSNHRLSAGGSSSNLEQRQFQSLRSADNSDDAGIEISSEAMSRDSLPATTMEDYQKENRESRMSVLEASWSAPTTSVPSAVATAAGAHPPYHVQWFDVDKPHRGSVGVDSEFGGDFLAGDGDSMLQFRDESMSFEHAYD